MISEQLHKDAIRFKEWHEGRAAQAKNCATFNVTPALQEIAAGHEKVAATIAALLDALPQPAPSPQPDVSVVSDEQIDALAAGNNYPGTVPGYRRFARAILALRPAVEPMTPEQWCEVLGTAGVDLLELAKMWSDNKIHVYQFTNEAEKIVKAAVLRGITAKAEDAHKPTKEAEKAEKTP